MLYRLQEKLTTRNAMSKRAAVAAWLARAFNRWQLHRTQSVLESLSDETLRDIGITRGEISDVARRVTGPVSQAARSRAHGASYL